ncbi:MAG: hypothetical protein PW735_09245 [Acidobacteriaceae bacterium]|nr:hypothetical protein [Acidobacteriaceae bacterium]
MKKLIALFLVSAACVAGAQTATSVTRNNDGSWMIRSGALSQGNGVDGPQQEKDDLFAGTDIFEKNATEVTDINMDPSSLSMVGGKNATSARRMLLNTVKTYEYDQPGMYNMADVDHFRQRLNTGDWHCSVHTRNLKTGESTDVCQKARNDGYREDAIITVEKKELTFIHRVSRIGGGQSELGPLPVGYDISSPMVPQLAMLLPGEMAGLSAQVQAETAGLQAEMLALTATGKLNGLRDLQRGLLNSKLNNIQPLSTRELEQFRLYVLPPAPPVAPAPPAKPLE